MEQGRIPCPFVYANGKRCTGHVTRVEAYKADLEWALQPDSTWKFGCAPRSHFHLFCSEKGNHAGYARPDNDQMKLYFNQLPEQLRHYIDGR
jgi:hypothetical protein